MRKKDVLKQTKGTLLHVQSSQRLLSFVTADVPLIGKTGCFHRSTFEFREGSCSWSPTGNADLQFNDTRPRFQINLQPAVQGQIKDKYDQKFSTQFGWGTARALVIFYGEVWGVSSRGE